MYNFIKDIDRRWIFLAMFFAVLVPILLQLELTEKPSKQTHTVYDAIEDLPDGSLVWIAIDYDPSTKGELGPMAAAFTRHCAKKKHKICFITLFATGPPMIQECVKILEDEFPEYEYGVDYVNLGFQPGAEGVVKVVVSNLRKLFSADHYKTDLNELPLTKNMKNLESAQLLVNISGGDPGTKQWIQYASTPNNVKTVCGCTGVQAPALYPYIPSQLAGMLGAIKGAAEYEQILLNRYPEFKENKKTQEALRRMPPQLVAHLLMVFLIIVGNVIFFIEKRKGSAQ